MALTYSVASSGKTALAVVVGLALTTAVAAGVYLWPEGETHTAASAPSSSSPLVALSPHVDTPTHETSASAVAAELAQAKSALAQQPVPAPIVSTITERPDYVSPMEWSMLKGLADQHASPQQELIRLVNSLRFNKQFEAWEALPKTADTASQRQTLAASLAADLPDRVRRQDMGLKDAQQALMALLADLEPDAGKRSARLAQEQQGLRQASPP